MKRGVWIALALGGALISAALVVFLFVAIFLDPQANNLSERSNWLAPIGSLLLVAIACIAALFLKRSDAEALAEPSKAKIAPWLQEMRRKTTRDK